MFSRNILIGYLVTFFSTGLVVTLLQLNLHYNIASRVTQSNSVYISVLKIPIVHADASDGMSKWPLLAWGKILYFMTIMDTNRDSDHQSQNEDNFPTFFLGLEFLSEAETEKNNGNGD